MISIAKLSYIFMQLIFRLSVFLKSENLSLFAMFEYRN